MTDNITVNEILKFFRLFCSVPHGSGNEQKLSDKLCEWLYERGFSPEQDAHGNIVCDVPGTASGPLVALQAHLDMVCAVGSPTYRPQSDPIRPIEKDGWICTAGESSLGADCGAGAAVMLWLAVHDEFFHPPLRLIFTVSEEVGLVGANLMDPSCMADVAYFLNLDGFCFGKAVVGSAGGVRIRMTRPVETEPVSDGMLAYRLTLDGLTGGHSGADIDKKRINAIRHLCAALRGLAEHRLVRLFDLDCGTAFNAIPAVASCAFVTDRDPNAWLAQCNAQLALSCAISEPDAKFTLEPCDLPAAVYTEDLTTGILALAADCPNGVFQPHASFPALVGDSSNFGVLRADETTVTALAMLRCANEGANEALIAKYSACAAENGFVYAEDGRYPAWPVLNESTLVEKARVCFEAVTGIPLAAEAYHVGLEPAIFRSFNTNAQCITLGMTIENCHSPSERWKVDTILPFADFMRHLLAALSNN